MKQKSGIIALILSIIALAVSVAALAVVLRPAPQGPAAPETAAQEPAVQETPDIQYVMYLGTNDKDTNQPVYSAEEARDKAEEILLKHFGGYTIQEASGGWIDGDKVYREYTLVIYLSDTTLDAVHSAADDMIREFSQSSVLIHANETTTEFYSGK